MHGSRNRESRKESERTKKVTVDRNSDSFILHDTGLSGAHDTFNCQRRQAIATSIHVTLSAVTKVPAKWPPQTQVESHPPKSATSHSRHDGLNEYLLRVFIGSNMSSSECAVRTQPRSCKQ